MAYEKLKISQGYPETDMTLLYNLDYEGMSATIEIFNSKGISVCRPVKNLELQQSGEIYIGEEWRTFRSEIPGIYILHIECKNNKDSFSKRIVFPVVP